MLPVHVALLCAVLLALPVQFLVLPGNLAPADLLALGALPFAWRALLRGGALRLPFLWPLLLLLAATALSSVSAKSPTDGIVTALTEVYLYALFLTFALTFEHASTGHRRLLLKAWLAAVLVNAGIVLAQLSPGVLRTMGALVSSVGEIDEWRPSGLFSNCNSAAMFQWVGFVPLVLLRLERRRALAFGGLLLASVLATGSMGATTAVLVGGALALLLRFALFRDWRGLATTSMSGLVVLFAGLVLGGLLLTQFPAVGEKFEYLFTGRAERSATGRLAIWERGLQLVLAEGHLFGVGSGNFVRIMGQEMHNDFLGFTVERGLPGTLALLVFMATVFRRGFEAVRLGVARGDPSPIILPACALAACAASLTHEIFHFRELWIALAVQEACTRPLWAERDAHEPIGPTDSEGPAWESRLGWATPEPAPADPPPESWRTRPADPA